MTIRDPGLAPDGRTAGANVPAAQSTSWTNHLRSPNEGDAVGMHRLVAETEVLDLNSTYTYLLMATDFASTSIVAEKDGRIHGLITGYHPPARPEVLFVWQVAVAAAARGSGLASAMLDGLVHRVRANRRGHPVTVEATVTPSNSASRAFFGAFARRHGVPLVEEPRFTAAHLAADESHEDEPTVRIGPITTPLAD